MYTATTCMDDSCLANADGDMLIVPQQGKEGGWKGGRIAYSRAWHGAAVSFSDWHSVAQHSPKAPV
jgi:hypothetical protein